MTLAAAAVTNSTNIASNTTTSVAAAVIAPAANLAGAAARESSEASARKRDKDSANVPAAANADAADSPGTAQEEHDARTAAPRVPITGVDQPQPDDNVNRPAPAVPRNPNTVRPSVWSNNGYSPGWPVLLFLMLATGLLARRLLAWWRGEANPLTLGFLKAAYNRYMPVSRKPVDVDTDVDDADGVRSL